MKEEDEYGSITGMLSISKIHRKPFFIWSYEVCTFMSDVKDYLCLYKVHIMPIYAVSSVKHESFMQLDLNDNNTANNFSIAS